MIIQNKTTLGANNRSGNAWLTDHRLDKRRLVRHNVIMEKEIKYYYTADGKCPYIEWRNSLDLSIRLRINKRIEKLKIGLYGDHKSLQQSKLS